MSGNSTLLGQSLAMVRHRIVTAERRFGRAAGSVQLLAVSKMQPAAALEAAFRSGQHAFGESYLQEAVDKQIELADVAIEWHFIGPIQANKAKSIAQRFDWVHSIDRIRVAERLATHRPDHLPPLNVLLQVNVSGEASKSGVTAAELPALATAVTALPRLRLRGLMCVPAPATDFAQQRAPFRLLREQFDVLRAEGYTLDTLSMGMSDDLEAAIAEGSTIVRIGTAIFGERPQAATEKR
jgi:pyridoxal phosphate enzyme (YggS family)